MKNKGFTIIELVVVVAIIVVLSGVVLFSVTQYLNKGKDSNVSGNLAVLIPAGEAYYNISSNSYARFCDPTQSTGTVFKNTISQMPDTSAAVGYCYGTTYAAGSPNDVPGTNPKGVCCAVKTS